MPLQPVLLDKPLALALRDLARQAIPPLSFAARPTSIHRAPGARLCYVEMVAPEEDSDLNAEVLLSVCGYNPGDRLLVEAQAGISVPTVGQKAWVIWVANPTEEVDGEHCPPHWVTFDGGGCPNKYILEILGNPNGGSIEVRLSGSVAVSVDIPWDASRNEIKTLLEAAVNYNPAATPPTGFPVHVAGEPTARLPGNDVVITLPSGVWITYWAVAGDLTRGGFGSLAFYAKIRSCCGGG